MGPFVIHDVNTPVTMVMVMVSGKYIAIQWKEFGRDYAIFTSIPWCS